MAKICQRNKTSADYLEILILHPQSFILGSMKILGIDPGYGRCGYAILSGNQQKPQLESFGVIITKPQKVFAMRLQEIAEDFESLIEKFKPEVLAIEDLFFVKNVTTGLKVSQVRGMLIYIAHKNGLQITEPKPVEIKSCFTGNGKAEKNEMKKMAQIIFGLKNSPQIDDAADAIGAAYYAFQHKFL